MQTRNRNKERSVRLSTIAHSPVPLAGMSYVLERSPRNPANARRNALDSPYAKAASLQAIYSDQTDTLYAHPTRFLPFPTAEVPAWYRPDPVLLSTLQPERVPTEQDRYRPPTTNTETLQAEADQPTARWIILPNRATTVYPLRQRFPEAEFALRRGKVYARVPTDDPADTPPLPERYYEEPPADLRRVQRDPLPNDATMFLYLYPHAPKRLPSGLPPTYPSVTRPRDRYLAVPIPYPQPPEDSPAGLYLSSYVSEIHAPTGTPPDALPNLTAHRYLPPRVSHPLPEQEQPPAADKQGG